MALKFCTFTGLDEKFSLEDFEIMSSRFSFLEWGILYSTSENSNLNANRYPSQKWFEYNIEKIREIADKTGVKLALHVCGKETKNLINGSNEFLNYLLDYFDRVQINFQYKKQYKDNLLSLFSDYEDLKFITQHNHSNEKILHDLGDIANHQILFDTSGGRGVMAQNWLDPLEGKMCGYAGGLGPDNIEQELVKINQTAANKDYWIDMESKLRTDEWLDYQKCHAVAKEVSYFIKSLS